MLSNQSATDRKARFSEKEKEREKILSPVIIHYSHTPSSPTLFNIYIAM